MQIYMCHATQQMILFAYVLRPSIDKKCFDNLSDIVMLLMRI